MTDASDLPTHELFPPTGSPESRVTFKSSDGIVFHLQRRYLETNAGAFPGPELQTNGELVELTETAETLAILFQFTQPNKYPHLEKTPFKCLMSVGEAAEKYEVYTAMSITALRMESLFNPESGHLSDEQCIAILNHAVKHDYPTLINQAARLSARRDLGFILSRLAPEIIPAWAQYRTRWDSIFVEASSRLRRKHLFGGELTSLTSCDLRALDNDGEDAPYICGSCFCLLDSWIFRLSQVECYASLKSQVHERIDTGILGIENIFCAKCALHSRCIFLPTLRYELKSAINLVPGFTEFLRK